MVGALVRRRAAWLAVAALALLAYVPALASSPGRMPADTKLYLYLDPGRLIGDAPWTFDGRQFAGWVPHQVIAYLWPQGPWYWLGQTAGLPDWVAHRLWIGTLLFLAGGGVLWAARRLGLSVAAALAAAIVYQLAPYVLPYVSRTSAMLLPWAGLGWIVALTVAAATRSRWRHAALVALVIASVGAVNATALLMIAPAPLLWLLVSAAERRITWRRATSTAVRIGSLSLGVSLWWIAMVVVQGRRGADVLAYSESLESVSFTSTSTEVWRGLGYWLTYVRDPYAATTTAAADHMVSGRVIAAGFVLLLVAVAGLVATRWRYRRFAIGLVVTGVVLAVGVHPFDDPSPLMSLLLGDGTSGAGLALRSSTRAVPVLMLGLALGAGALVDAVAPLRRRSIPTRPLALGAVVVLAVVNMPSLTGARFVDPALERDQSPPAAWLEAAAALDAMPTGYRVLQLPGSEFGAFRWGYTVDPPLPGLMDRPLVTRDLLPLGSPAAMDLLYALDDRLQAGVAEPDAIAPVARLLGADTVWLTGDHAFDRFRTPRPELLRQLLTAGATGLGAVTPFGEPAANRPDLPMVDEQTLSEDAIGQPVPPVELVEIEDPQPVIRAKADTVVVVGSGDGVVDAAGAGLLQGDELVRYFASLDDQERVDVVAAAAQVIVTDTNRRRARHWRSSQDVTGYTESPDGPAGGVLRTDVADERLPVFGSSPEVSSMTVAVQEGPVRATASAYGEPFAYRPEDRAVMAIDGDPTTSWVVADRAAAEGELIRLEIDEPVDHVTLHQPAEAARRRHLGAVTITVEGRPPLSVALDDRSLSADGQRVDIEPTTASVDDPTIVTITIDAVVVPDPGDIGPALAAVGFAEIDVGLDPTLEVVVPPPGPDQGATATTTVLTRLRTRPTDRWRSDPEASIVRDVTIADVAAPAGGFHVEATLRLDQRATDAVLAELLGIDGATASDRLTGVAAAAGWAATDDDAQTAWITPFADPLGATLDVTLGEPTSSFELRQPTGDFSPVTSLRLRSDGAPAVDVDVPPPDPDGVSRIELTDDLPAGSVRLEITSVEPRFTLDRRYGEPVVLPAGISELSIGRRTITANRLVTECRRDLLTLDGVPVLVRVEATVAELLAGDPVTATSCDDGASAPLVELGGGTHRVRSTPGANTGLHVDRVVLRPAVDAPTAPMDPPAPTVTVESTGRIERTVTVDDCADGCWLVLGEGHHEAWSASTEAGDLGPPELVDGGFNGWWIDPTDDPLTVELRWTAQTPLTVALVLTALFVLVCIALAAGAGRRLDNDPDDSDETARLEWIGLRTPRKVSGVAAVVWTVGATVLVAPIWGIAGAVGGAGLVVLGRPRFAGYAALAMLGFVGASVVTVVARERPYPDAGWPARFEHLHELGLFAAVSLAVAAFAAGAAGTDQSVSRDRRSSGGTPTTGEQ